MKLRRYKPLFISVLGLASRLQLEGHRYEFGNEAKLTSPLSKYGETDDFQDDPSGPFNVAVRDSASAGSDRPDQL